jgi:hypothetical protein
MNYLFCVMISEVSVYHGREGKVPILVAKKGKGRGEGGGGRGREYEYACAKVPPPSVHFITSGPTAKMFVCATQFPDRTSYLSQSFLEKSHSV